ncbi:TPA: hypothetical protein NIB55_005849 [Pseudomonas aeruginosa]|jgi:hypothetical protein|uniref:hypothetical protein n=1 Tax=Kangiella sp. TaxID=1920245 RepID=UPI00295DFB17|nr:hypothetical protein [Pseudomonas aeruginosa]HEE9764591.1 hypothetical protein [Pseudomonas putida]
MLKAAVMFVAVMYGGGGEKTYTIPGYASLEECKASQASVTRQLLAEPFVSEAGVEASKRSLPDRVRTKCIVL